MKIASIKEFIEYLGGAQDQSEFPCLAIYSVYWSFWWAFLVTVIYIFSGQTSDFIYIDF